MSKSAFLKEILGKNGFKAFENAIGLSKNLEDLVFIRGLLSWVNLISKYGYDDNLPGQEKHFTLNKSESGLTGTIELEEQFYSFNDKSEEYVAAILAMAMNTLPPKINTKGTALVKLGKSIDCLVKTEFVSQEVKKAHPPYHPPEKPAQMAAPIPQTPPIQPEAIETKQLPGKKEKKGTSLAKQERKKSFIFRLKKADLNTKCDTCGNKLFKNETFSGCYCYPTEGIDLYKHQSDFIIKFDPEHCDGDFILSLMGNIKDASK